MDGVKGLHYDQGYYFESLLLSYVPDVPKLIEEENKS